MNVLFVCVQNAGRSQIAEALFRLAAGDEHEARSAGSAPAGRVHPEVVEVMVQAADVVVTMGCGDACPVLPGKRYVDWELTDPAGLPADEVRSVRDEIDRRVNGLVNDLGRAGEKVEADPSGA